MGLLAQTAKPAKELLGVDRIAVVADRGYFKIENMRPARRPASQCTGNQFRCVSRLENEALLDRMQARIAQRSDILDQRRETVEHPFSSIKQWMNQGAFLMRGLEKVRSEFSLTALDRA